jgi:surface antigen
MRVASVRLAPLVAVALLPAFIAACGFGSQQGGALLGVTGSVAGAPAGRDQTRAAAAPTGAVIGGIGGSEAGRQMSDRERAIAASAEYRALEYGRSGAPTGWDYPATNHRGSIVPGRPYQRGSQYCRTYAHAISGGGAPETVKGIACREPNGTWRSAG